MTPMDLTSRGTDRNGGPRILVVDDEPRIRATLSHTLQLFGYDSEAVGRGQDALDRLTLAPWDVLILDLQMPGIDGLTVMQKARELQPEIAIIILTGHATVENAITAANLEAVDYLRKPASVQQILTSVARALQARQEQVQRRTLLDTLAKMTEPLRAQAAPPRSEYAAGRQWVGSVIFDPQRREVRLTDRPEHPVVQLTEGEAVILGQLMAKPDRAVSCRELARPLIAPDMERWNAESVVRPVIFRLRNKIEIAPKQPRLIRAVRGSGYMWVSNPDH